MKVVGQPDITDLKFEPGEPIKFKADFEVAPQFELGTYRGLPVTYEEPAVTDEEIEKRLEGMRESKADYVNLDPRPIENADDVLVHLKSVSGLAEPIDQDGLQVTVGAEETLPEFTANLVGSMPEDVKEFDVHYPAEYAQGSDWPERPYVFN